MGDYRLVGDITPHVKNSRGFRVIHRFASIPSDKSTLYSGRQKSLLITFVCIRTSVFLPVNKLINCKALSNKDVHIVKPEI